MSAAVFTDVIATDVYVYCADVIVLVSAAMRKSYLVSKSKDLIEARFRLPVAEQRLIALLVAKIHPDDEDFKPYRFKIAAIARLFDTAAMEVRREVEKLTKSLLGRTLQIREPDGLLQINWMYMAKYHDDSDTVELKFGPELRPYLLQLQEKCFAQYRIENITQLQSRYSVRLYELLKQYEVAGNRKFYLHELREVLGLLDHEYKLFGDFKRRILDQAKKELPKKTDIQFSYKTAKKGHAVNRIYFKIWRPKHLDNVLPNQKKLL